MTNEDKELLLKDLCARLPYGIWFQSYHSDCGEEGRGTFNFHIGIDSEDAIAHIKAIIKTDNNKPYLRPMSSMTGSERIIYEELCLYYEEFGEYVPMLETFVWLNAHHFDYRGLIEKGLALEAHEGMYKTE